MRKKIPWFDMIGFYLVLPVAVALDGWICQAIYWEEGRVEFWVAGLFFYGFMCILFCSSIGIFFVRLVDNVGKAIENAFRETWDMMVDTVIEAQSSR